MTESESTGFFVVGVTTPSQDVVRLFRYIVAALIVLLNISIAIAFLVQKLRRPARTPMKPAGLFVLNMLFADAFFGVIILALSKRPPLLDLRWCGLMAGGFYLSTAGSHIAFINLLVDRFVGVVYPEKYASWMTTRRSRILVGSGWVIPFVGLAAGILSASHTEPVIRCSDIEGIRIFLTWLWIPTHIFTTLCIIAVQFLQFLNMRSYEMESWPFRNRNLRYSQRSSQILLYFTMPTSVWLFGYFLSVISVMWNQLSVLDPVLLHSVLLLGVELSVLTNAVVYSYETATIKKPVRTLLKDLSKWWRVP